MKQYTQNQIKFLSDQFQQGQKAIQAGKLNHAEKCYLDILKIDKNIIEAQNALAFIYTVTKQHAKAVAQLNEILKFQPNDANTHYNLANNFHELQSYENALQHYQRAIALNPNLIDSHIQCGLIFYKTKNYELSLQHLNNALDLDNFNVKAIYALGMTYAEIKDYPRALQHLEQAARLAPNDRQYSLTLARVLQNSGNDSLADVQYHHTCNKFPDYADAFLSYGDYLFEKRFYNEALECFNRAHQLSPDNIDILDDLGTTYLGLADAEQAMENFKAALSKEPNRLTSLIGVEQVYQDLGKLKEAENLCDQIIALDVKNPAGYLLKSKIKKSKPDDGLSEALKKLLSEVDSLNDGDKYLINFSLGKIYDDHNNYEEAFKYYAAGNAFRMSQLNYDKQATENLFSKFIDFFSIDLFKKLSQLGSQSNLPIIILGMPRSGTTLTEQIISSHPKVAAAGEVKYWGALNYELPSLLNTKLPFPECLLEIRQEHAKNITQNYESTLHKTAASKPGALHITDKMPHNFLFLGLIAALFPNVKIIHTRRDPVDTCLSIFFQSFNDSHPYSFDLAYLGHYYRQYERLMKHWKEILPGRIMDINYADTVSDPEYWSRKLIEHVGLEWHDDCLSPHKLERSVKTASHWQVRQPIYKTSVQRWKNYEKYIQPLIQALNTESN